MSEDGEAEAAPSAAPKSDLRRRRRLKGPTYYFQIAQHRIAPRRWLHPRYRKEPAEPRQRDVEENRVSTPGDAQAIDLRCVWAVEFYTPSQIEGLFRSLEEFGLEDLHANSARGPIDWLREIRMSASRGGWMNLGMLVREKGKYLGGMIMPAPLPQFAESANLAMFNVAPSFVAITASFMVGPDEGKRFEQELRTERKTRRDPLPNGYTVVGPESQKREAIGGIRAEHRTEVREWFNQHLPGFFCATSARFGPPVCDFLVLEGIEPFSSGNFRGAADLLGVRDEFSAFEAEGWPGVRFSPSVDHWRSRAMHAVLAAEVGALPSLKDTGYGNDRLSHAYYLDHAMTELMVQWGAVAALDHFELRLSQVRDLSIGWTRRNASKSLEELQALTRESLDLTTVCRDFASTGRQWRHERPKFRSLYKVAGTQAGELSQQWTASVATRAKRVLEEDAAIKALVVQNSDLLTARENIRLQHSVRLLAFLTLIATLLAGAEPAKSIYDAGAKWVCSSKSPTAVRLSAIPLVMRRCRTNATPLLSRE